MSTPEVISPLVTALEAAYADMRMMHPDLPPATIVVASRGKRPLHGYFHAQRWQVEGIETPVCEIMMAAESLTRGAVATWGTLAHEATHALCRERGVQETDKSGRRHNKKFAAMATEAFGLEITEAQTIGWSVTAVPEETAAANAAAIARIEAAIMGQRCIDTSAKSKSKNLLKCECDCGTIIRMSPKALEAAPILCEGCFSYFREA